MTDVIDINQKKKVVDPVLVDMIKELLESAESGDLKSLIFVDSYQDGSVGESCYGLISEVCIAKLYNLQLNLGLQMNGIVLE